MKKTILMASAAILYLGNISESWAAISCVFDGPDNDGKYTLSVTGTGTGNTFSSYSCTNFSDTGSASWPEAKKKIASVSFDDDSVTSIANNTFSYATSLQSVTMTNVTSIGANAFQATNLTNVDMPNVTSIGGGAFRDATKLESVTMPKVTEIGDRAFQQSGLTSVDMPNVTSLGSNAFTYATKLESVTMPKVTEIGNHTFNGATKLESIYMPNVTSIGFAAFGDATSLTSIDLSNVTTLQESVFGGSYKFPVIIISDETDTTYWDKDAFKSSINQPINIRCVDSQGNDSIDINACTTVIERFLPDEDGKCQTGITCLTYLQKINNTCVGKYFGSVSGDGTCIVAGSCKAYGNYINLNTRQCVTPASCTGMYVADTVNKKCFKMPGCVNYADGACQECDSNYLTNSSGTCTPAADCKNGMHATLYGSCEENPAGCNTFEDDRCLECNDGLFRQGESCVSSCGANYKLSGDTCYRVRYTPAEAAEVVGEKNTIFLYYK